MYHVLASERMLTVASRALASLSASESSLTKILKCQCHGICYIKVTTRSTFENPFRSILIDMGNSSICGTVQPCSCSSPSSLSIHAVHAARAPASCRRAWHAAQLSVKCFRMSTSLLQSMTCGAPHPSRVIRYICCARFAGHHQLCGAQASQKRKQVRHYRAVEVQHDQVLLLAHLTADHFAHYRRSFFKYGK